MLTWLLTRYPATSAYVAVVILALVVVAVATAR